MLTLCPPKVSTEGSVVWPLSLRASVARSMHQVESLRTAETNEVRYWAAIQSGRITGVIRRRPVVMPESPRAHLGNALALAESQMLGDDIHRLREYSNMCSALRG
jgi:hypothetical protein